ncbi:MAG: hypothetical protein RL885_09230 [Planctomycetota bacterium]
MHRLVLTALAGLAMTLFVPALAQADGARRAPGSLLIYPVYLSGSGSMTLISITNTHNDPGFEPASNQSGVVNVHFVYIDGTTWDETNRFESLTPNDTLTVVASEHNSGSASGFLYCVAFSPTGGAADLDYLVGDSYMIDSEENILFGMPAVAFCALTGNGNPTDVNGNGNADFDGVEYERAGDQQIISSFIGQGLLVESFVALVSLAGNADYLTEIDLLVYNDNEQIFSSHFSFRCWAYVSLTTLGGVFKHSFLNSTNTDPDGGPMSMTTGWARLDGDRAVDTVGNENPVNDPPFVGAQIRTVFGFGAAHLLRQTAQENPTAGVLDF